MKSVNFKIQIIGEHLVVSNSETQLTKSYRISALNLARLGADILQMYTDSPDAQKLPTIEKKETRLARLSTSPDYWTVSEYAAYMRICETTVKKYCIAGSLDARKIAGRWRIEGKLTPDRDL